ncbi:MAG: hypothetical protein JXX29_11220 [Deltaproteobacteria bacterium]|nr:hypothetical protein [Deltaproteobacteria bacterium]MBN2672241.1 hypothetical protein [Deltaproteobacteria bacterium]
MDTKWKLNSRFVVMVLCVTTIAFVGCKDDKKSNNDDEFVPQEIVASEKGALSIASQTACAIDEDCAAGLYCFQDVCAYDCLTTADCAGEQSCNARGQCVIAGADGVEVHQTEDQSPAIQLMNVPERRLVVENPGDPATVELVLDSMPPGGVISYTEQRSDYGTKADGNPPAPEVKQIPVREEDGKIKADIPLESTSLSLPGYEGGTVDIIVRSNVGTLKFNMGAEKPISGTYAGEANVTVFGNVGLPLEFQIVTNPENAALADADSAYMLLNVTRGNIFSPVDVYEGAPEYLSTELVFDDFLGRWVAIFENEYVLSDSALMASPQRGQIGRVLRFEIEPYDDGVIIGSFSDRWEGLYDARSTAGITELVDVLFEGEIQMTRMSDAIALADVQLPSELPQANPGLLGLPPTTSCNSADLFPDACTGITTNTLFENADNALQIECALTAADEAMAGDTTGGMLTAFLDDEIENPDGMSFADFMEACATGANGICVPSQQVLCARELLAYAYQNQDGETDSAADLVASYQDVSQEAFLGKQLAAFKVDSDTRLKWLQTSDYPAVVTSAVKDLITTLLNDWQNSVLDVHMNVLGGYFDPSGIAILSRAVSDELAVDARRRLLSDMIQAWRGSAEALSLASARWDQLYQDMTSRDAKSAYVTAQMFDLYLMAGMLTNLTIDAGSGYQSTAFGSGFSQLMRRAGKLSLTFDDKVFSRDAEIVVSTAVDTGDQNNANASLLADLQTEAESEIARAGESVQTVLAEAQEAALNETQLTNQMNNEINDLRTELVNMCGLPVGCTADEFRTTPTCEVLPSAGECGFSVDRATGELMAHDPSLVGVSEAGQALLQYYEAANGLKLANEEQRAFNARMQLEYESLEAFSEEVQRWNELRGENLSEFETLLEEQAVYADDSLLQLTTSLAEKAAIRDEQIQRMKTNLTTWRAIRIAGATADLAGETSSAIFRELGSRFEALAGLAEDTADAAAEAMPTAAGTTVDATAPARGAAQMAGASAKFGLVTSQNTMNAVAASIEIATNFQKSIREATLTELQEEAAKEDAISEYEITQIESSLEEAIANNDAAMGTLQEVYDTAVLQRETEMAYARDMDEFNQRRTAYLQMLEESAALDLKVEKARLNVIERQNAYLAVSQAAELQYGRLIDLEAQRADVNRLVGSPGVIFARANRLVQAENRLQRAKDKLMDWLVGLEYYAVRPFMDQRVQIYLAVNAYQLEDIAEELKRLESVCGGATNQDVAEISIRNSLMNVTSPIVDAVTGEEIAAEDRFRTILRDGYVPIDKRVRYTTDSTIGDIIKDKDRVLSATFDINLSDFANLASTCNAKVMSIAVQLVGEIGTARPTVSILYDGTSKLRSCQPGIQTYVEQIGEDLTNFGEITLLRTPGRSISPIAGINEWRSEEAANATLGGLPLASQYTLLVDTKIGENAALDWDNLEDVILEIRYSYQDVFPEGQCE